MGRIEILDRNTEVKIEEVIVVNSRPRGKGILPYSPMRKVREVFTKEGVPIAFEDPCGNYTSEDVFEFGKICKESKDQDIEELFESFEKIKLKIRG